VLELRVPVWLGWGGGTHTGIQSRRSSGAGVLDAVCIEIFEGVSLLACGDG
jgi:hypothetical protein